MFVIRLRLHMCSEHEHHHHNIQCPVCTKPMLGSVYEAHVVKEHPLLLKADSYHFSPKVLAIKKVASLQTINNQIKKLIMNQKASSSGPSQPYSIDFKVENPWEEILSTTNRRKRSADAITVGGLKKKMKTESSQNLGPEFLHNITLGTTIGSKSTYRSKFQTLRNKIEFISTLDSNTHYKQYLRCLRHLKMKKTLLLKYASRMSDAQIGKVRGEIQSNEQLLSRYSLMDKTPLKDGKMLGEDQKKLEKVPQVNPPISLGQEKVVNNNRTVSHIKTLPLQALPRNMPVIDLGENLAIKSEYPSRESVIALNIPMEDILDNNLVIDMKTEV